MEFYEELILSHSTLNDLSSRSSVSETLGGLTVPCTRQWSNVYEAGYRRHLSRVTWVGFGAYTECRFPLIRSPICTYWIPSHCSQFPLCVYTSRPNLTAGRVEGLSLHPLHTYCISFYLIFSLFSLF
jgi:hypothetical protein